MTKTAALKFQKECEQGAVQLRKNAIHPFDIEKIERLETTAALIRNAILNSDQLVSQSPPTVTE